ncbi:putative auxin-induced protein 5NG4-like [Capsicum annuum]|nr:putative auxin-induced protein 5NG4-like [Capsicum annuum]
MEITKEQLTTREIGGARYTNLKYAFDLGIHSLLTSCSKEAFCKAFPNFAPVQVDRLHRLFIQVIYSHNMPLLKRGNGSIQRLHLCCAYFLARGYTGTPLVRLYWYVVASVSSILYQDEFESLCVETQVSRRIRFAEVILSVYEDCQVLTGLQLTTANLRYEFFLHLFFFCTNSEERPTLNMVEQLVEEQNLDPLFPEKSNVEEVTHYLSEAKQNEISYLTTMLETAEEQKRAITSRLEVLKKERHDFSDAAAVDIVNKIWTVIKKYDTINDIGFHN